MRTAEQRFWRKVDPCRTDGCALWVGALNQKGYGAFRGPTTIKAHHFLVGKAPDGLQWDHLCRVRNCVWPEHLEAVTNRINVLRGVSGDFNRNRAAKITHCPHGHPYDFANTYINQKGHRYCRACRADSNRRYRTK